MHNFTMTELKPHVDAYMSMVPMTSVMSLDHCHSVVKHILTSSLGGHSTGQSTPGLFGMVNSRQQLVSFAATMTTEKRDMKVIAEQMNQRANQNGSDIVKVVISDSCCAVRVYLSRSLFAL